ncbi:MAG: SUMF1/EgtB/PvdO family nonheme iron enzyme, partial [Verrucomicrobia bacterium]|nr:SUMF1/EgtB/PvdO family nonheme iron enzyme [Verrucomicrobiota bacterium]
AVASTTCFPASGATFPIGTNSVTCLVKDTGGRSNSCSFTIAVLDLPGMALIPEGTFTMGDVLGDQFSSWESPVHSVYVSACYMDRYYVSKALWDTVYQWATAHGYNFDNPGSVYNGASYSKGSNHPVHLIDWYDAVKWCNARSEKEGLTPAYYTGTNLTTVYRTGQVNVQNDWVNWKTGYRLPTEAEWEKAGRGGLVGHRFPWGDTITQSQANYYSDSLLSYDISPTRGYPAAYTNGGIPYTSPVCSFPANDYGLHDMMGNVWAWCWDWFSGTYYASSPASDPRGPTSGQKRSFRGGSWAADAQNGRVCSRNYWYAFDNKNSIGFRCVRPPAQP